MGEEQFLFVYDNLESASGLQFSQKRLAEFHSRRDFILHSLHGGVCCTGKLAGSLRT